MEILAEDIRPVSDLKNKSTQLVGRVQTTRRPVLFTKNGKPAVVLMDAAEFAAKLVSIRLSSLLKEAERDIAEGKGRDLKEFFEEFTKKSKM